MYMALQYESAGAQQTDCIKLLRFYSNVTNLCRATLGMWICLAQLDDT